MSLLSDIIADARRLIRFRPEEAAADLRTWRWRTAVGWMAVITVGTGLYGASVGLWRSPLQGFYVGLKMPLLIFFTLVLNGALNGVLAALLGSGLGFRQTALAIMQSFALFALVVGSLAAAACFFTLVLPGATEPGGDVHYRLLLLAHTGIIAFAGVAANLRLLRVLEHFSSVRTARTVLVAWLAGNLFVGAQLSYNLRPFFGTPTLPVQFLRPNPFDGNFYVALWRIVQGLGRSTAEPSAGETPPTPHQTPK